MTGAFGQGVSIAVAPVDLPGAPVCTWGSLDNTCQQVRALGYDSIELLLRDPADATGLAHALEDHGLGLRSILTGPSLAVDGLSLALESSADDAVRRVRRHIRLASEYGAAVVLGWMTGIPREAGGVASSPNLTLESSLKAVGEHARDSGVRLLLEPLSRDEPGAARTMGEALRLCEALGEPFGIVLDLFHMSREETDVARAIEHAAHAVEHVQIADTNREPPGLGGMDFSTIFDALVRHGFLGTIGIEALPVPDPYAAASGAMTFLRTNDWTRRIAWSEGAADGSTDEDARSRDG